VLTVNLKSIYDEDLDNSQMNSYMVSKFLSKTIVKKKIVKLIYTCLRIPYWLDCKFSKLRFFLDNHDKNPKEAIQ